MFSICSALALLYDGPSLFACRMSDHNCVMEAAISSSRDLSSQSWAPAMTFDVLVEGAPRRFVTGVMAATKFDLTADDSEDSRLLLELGSCNLLGVAPALLELGAECLEDLALLSDADLLQAGIRLVPCRKLRRAAAHRALLQNLGEPVLPEPGTEPQDSVAGGYEYAAADILVA